MYLYSAALLELALWALPFIGLHWVRLTAVPPLDLLTLLPGGSFTAQLVVLSALYGLAWTAIAAALWLWQWLADGAGPAPGRPHAEALAASGFSRAGLEVYLWGTLIAVPLALGAAALYERPGQSADAALPFFAAVLCAAAAEALRPFAWRGEFGPLLRRLPASLAQLTRLPQSGAGMADAAPDDAAADLLPLTDAEQPGEVWGAAWRQAGMRGNPR